MNRGCVPFGHMMLASNVVGAISFGRKLGFGFDGVTPDYGELKKRQDELIGFMRMGVTSTLKKNKIELIEGRGELAGKGNVSVNGETIACKNVILATGARWMKPDFPGGDPEEVINSDDLLAADALPEKALLFGRSPWLLEIAQFLHRFGKKVVLATPEKSILNQMKAKPFEPVSPKPSKPKGLKFCVRPKSPIWRKKRVSFGGLNFKKGSETLEVDRVVHLERTPH
jgi:dihydrolipoamide dehydrogenase